MFREYNLETVSGIQDAAWGEPPNLTLGEPILYIRGNMNDRQGSQYNEKYLLQNITFIQDNS